MRQSHEEDTLYLPIEFVKLKKNRHVETGWLSLKDQAHLEVQLMLWGDDTFES